MQSQGSGVGDPDAHPVTSVVGPNNRPWDPREETVLFQGGGSQPGSSADIVRLSPGIIWDLGVKMTEMTWERFKQKGVSLEPPPLPANVSVQ